MANKLTIQHKRSSVSGNAPAAGVLQPGELAVNLADRSIYTEDGGGNVIELAKDIQVLATAPTGGNQGDFYYNTTDDKLYSNDGTSWVAVGGDGGGGSLGRPVTGFNLVQYGTVTVTGLNNLRSVAVFGGGSTSATGGSRVLVEFFDGTNWSTGTSNWLSVPPNGTVSDPIITLNEKAYNTDNGGVYDTTADQLIPPGSTGVRFQPWALTTFKGILLADYDA